MQEAEAFLLFSCDTLIPSEVGFHTCSRGVLLLFWETERLYKMLNFENVIFMAIVNSHR